MSIFSRRKRLLNRTPKAPKMSSRRQFHRALRRHPAWPAVMEQAAARARAQKAAQRDRVRVMATGQASGRAQVRRALRRNRAGVIALIAVGALLALLTGLAVADGVWSLENHHQTGTPPSARFGMASTRDGTRNEILIFGGFGATGIPVPENPKGGDRVETPLGGVSIPENPVRETPGGTPVALGDTWGFIESNKSWINRTPALSPSPRGYASMAYHSPSKNTVLFGGAKYRDPSSISDETWTWNGETWTLRNPPGPRPPARQNASMVYDAHRKVVVMFGGRGTPDVNNTAGVPLDDTWTWDGSVWEKLKPALSPPARHSAAMAYDLCRGEAVLFGGSGKSATQPLVGGFNAVAGETWIWNGSTWTPKTGLVPSPPARIGASMTYSRRLGQVLLYGGLTTTDNNVSLVATDTDIWGWNGSAWRKDNSEAVTLAMQAVFPPISWGTSVLATYVTLPPPPRAYASFEPLYEPGAFNLFGGTPIPDQGLEGGILSSTPRTPQVPLPDQWMFNDSLNQSLVGASSESPVGINVTDVADVPEVLAFSCADPVPLPPDEPPVDGQVVEGPQLRKLETRQEVKETGRLPALRGKPGPECPGASSHPGNTHLVTDPQRNRIYQFFICNRESPPWAILIQAYDAKTLEPVGSAIAPVQGSTALNDAIFNGLMHDADRGSFLFHWFGKALIEVQQDLIEKGFDTLLKPSEVKQITLAESRNQFAGTGNAVLSGLGNAISSVSFFNHPKTGRAKLLITYYGQLNFPPSLAQLDLLDNRVDWRSAGFCAGPTAINSFPQPNRSMRTGASVYTHCIAAGTQYGVVRIPVVEVANDAVANDGEEAGTPEVFPGPFDVTTVWGDPQAERMLLLSQNNANQSLWVFDGKSSRYVGRSALTAGASGGWGFDQEAGRFYTLVHDHRAVGSGSSSEQPMIQGGLLTVDTRLTPVPPPEKFGQFSHPSVSRIGVLPPEAGLPTKVFVRRWGGQPIPSYPDGEKRETVQEMHYTILTDLLPVPRQPEPGQLDALTIPVAESAGKTDVAFEAEGSGYGMRLRALGGISGVLDYSDDFIQFGGNKLAPVCFYPDREMMAGWVSQVHLSDLEASARSLGLEADPATKTDLEAPFSRCQPPVGPTSFPSTAKAVADVLWPLLPFMQLDNAVGAGILSLEKDPAEDDFQHDTGTGLAWGEHFQDVECGGDSNASHTADIGDVYASATCEQKKARVEGVARGAAFGASAGDGFSVGESYSNVVVAREAQRGVVVTATAVAKAIKLGPITIGMVKTEAVAWSNGRPSDNPRASYTRTICRVTSPNFDHEKECLTEQEQKDMVVNFNKVLGNNATRGQVALPTPDRDFLKGTPGGYIAGVIKPLAEEAEEQIFTREVQRELPGLAITFYRDNQTKGYGRQVLQLAAVRAVTGFGVTCGSDFIYSPSAKDCVALSFAEELPVESEEFEEDAGLSEDDIAFDSESGWTPVEAGAPGALSLGRRLGRLIETLPILRQLPIRQMGEALLAGSVWLLLTLPLALTARRFALNLARGAK